MKFRFAHPHGDEMQPGDFIEMMSKQGPVYKWIIFDVGVGWFDAVLWKWYHEVMWWNPCNDFELVIAECGEDDD